MTEKTRFLNLVLLGNFLLVRDELVMYEYDVTVLRDNGIEPVSANCEVDALTNRLPSQFLRNCVPGEGHSTAISFQMKGFFWKLIVPTVGLWLRYLEADLNKVVL